MNWVQKLVCLSVLFVATAALASSPAAVKKVSVVKVSTKQSRVSIDLNKETSYHYFVLHQPERLVVDLDQTKLTAPLSQTALNGSGIKKIRSGHPKPEKTRLVFDLELPFKAKSLALHHGQGYVERIQLDLYRQAKGKPHSHAKLQPKPILSAKEKDNAERKVTVLIDPGHGGKDPGATGFYGTHEKDVVLAIATILADRINREPGMQAVMTRQGNYFVSLRNRLQKARQNKADIFIAIHADAFKDKHSRGASVYALSLRGASSEAARWLAAKENYSELGGVDLHGKNTTLRSVLLDLSQTATISASLQLGDEVMHQLGHVATLHHHKVEQAPFVVLKSPDIPSILIETGFISNPKEEYQLKQTHYQKQLAEAVVSGIRFYFYKRPLPGTWLAAHAPRVREVQIASGDSLSVLAQRFNVSVDHLKRLNHLQSNTIRIGQRLVVPV